jgi:preprotein translocase subunit SecA
VFDMLIADYCVEKNSWEEQGIKKALLGTLSIDYDSLGEKSDAQKLKEKILIESDSLLDMKIEIVGADIFEQFQKFVIFRTIDQKWKEHLHGMDQLREGINLRAYGQKNPLVEYKQEGYEMFTQMMIDTNEETLKRIFRSNIVGEKNQVDDKTPKNINLSHDKMPIDFVQPPSGQGQENQQGSMPKRRPPVAKPIEVGKKYGRNDKVKIAKGSETKELKYKKAEALIAEGWIIVE